MNPYVYRITHIESGRFYIGYKQQRRKNGEVMVIGEDYFTTSPDSFIKESYTKDNLHEWRTEILTEIYDEYTGDMGLAANVIEQILILKEWNNPLCMNGAVKDLASGDNLYRPNYEWNYEECQGASDRMKDKWADEEYRQMQIEARTHYDDPEWRAAQSQISINLWADPEWASRVKQAQAEGHAKLYRASCIACRFTTKTEKLDKHYRQCKVIRGDRKISRSRSELRAEQANIKFSCIKCHQVYEVQKYNKHYGGEACTKEYKRINMAQVTAQLKEAEALYNRAQEAYIEQYKEVTAEANEYCKPAYRKGGGITYRNERRVNTIVTK